MTTNQKPSLFQEIRKIYKQKNEYWSAWDAVGQTSIAVQTMPENLPNADSIKRQTKTSEVKRIRKK